MNLSSFIGVEGFFEIIDLSNVKTLQFLYSALICITSGAI